MHHMPRRILVVEPVYFVEIMPAHKGLVRTEPKSPHAKQFRYSSVILSGGVPACGTAVYTLSRVEDVECWNPDRDVFPRRGQFRCLKREELSSKKK